MGEDGQIRIDVSPPRSWLLVLRVTPPGPARPRTGSTSLAEGRPCDFDGCCRRPRARHRRQTGYRDMVMLRRYTREGSLFRENATGAVGL